MQHQLLFYTLLSSLEINVQVGLRTAFNYLPCLSDFFVLLMIIFENKAVNSSVQTTNKQTNKQTH